jgi:hypothetical protein
MAEQEGEPGKAPQSNKPPAAKEEAPDTDGLPTAVEPALVPVLQIMEETGVPEEAQEVSSLQSASLTADHYLPRQC